MGYTRIVRMGEITEVYQYEKDYVQENKRDYTQNNRRASTARERDSIIRPRSTASIKRAKTAFIRLVTANIQREILPAFFTLTIERQTPLEVGYAYLTDFWKHVKRKYGNNIRYIGVPEWQTRGVLHFHFLVWDIPRESTDNKTERSTRDFQRHWYRGFCDVRNATHSSGRLAGYLAKYLTEALNDTRLGNRRAYTSSRSVHRPSVEKSNQKTNQINLKSGASKKFQLSFVSNSFSNPANIFSAKNVFFPLIWVENASIIIIVYLCMIKNVIQFVKELFILALYCSLFLLVYLLMWYF